MKKKLYRIFAALAVLGTTACHDNFTDENAVFDNSDCKISFTATAEEQTRTTLQDYSLRWVKGDEVGMFAVGSQINGGSAQPLLDRSPVEFSGYIKNGVNPGDRFYAYYPYSSTQNTTSTSVRLTIPTQQTQVAAGEFNGSANPMVAQPMTFDGDATFGYNLGNVMFRQLGAIVELRIYSSEEALCKERIRSVTFASEKALAGGFTFNLRNAGYAELPDISGYTSKSAVTQLTQPAEVPATKADAASVYVVIAPGEYSGTITVSTDKAHYDFSFASALTFRRATVKVMNADIAQVERIEAASDEPIEFADLWVEQACVKAFDSNKDGYLSYAEAAAVTDLSRLEPYLDKNILSFDELQYFTSVTKIPDGRWYGDGGLFSFCKILESIVLPPNITEIGSYAFYQCSSLKNIEIPQSVKTIGRCAFEYCESLASIAIPEGITKLENGTFSGCKKLTSVTLPGTLTEIGSSTFSSCESLVAITIPEGVTTIGSSAFSSCKSLASIAITEGVTTIGSSTFFGCEKLASVTLPGTLTEIGGSTFYGCKSLTSIDIPEGVTSIGASAFEGSALMAITLPQSLESLGEGAFSDCDELQAFYGKFASEDHSCLIVDGCLTAVAQIKERSEYTIPEGITAIGASIFRGCENLRSVTIPQGITRIGDSAFSRCSSLEKIDLPQGLTKIGQYAFGGCSNLTRIDLLEGVTDIGMGAFQGCSNMISITIPDGIKAIQSYTFEYCHNLASISIPKTVREIGAGAFQGCSKLESIELPDIPSIQSYTFQGCTGLKSITLPSRIGTIGSGAFEGCYALTEITIPRTIKTIEELAFNSCWNLEAVTCLAPAVPTCAVNAFQGIAGEAVLKVPSAYRSSYDWVVFGAVEDTQSGWSVFTDLQEI